MLNYKDKQKDDTIYYFIAYLDPVKNFSSNNDKVVSILR